MLGTAGPVHGGAVKREVELKLELAPDAVEAFEQLPFLPADSDVAQLRAIYFDTPNLDLAERGVSLRIRKSGRKRVQTVKADGSGGAGLFARAEWEMPVRDDTPVLDARTPVAALLGERVDTIGPVFQVDVERRTWLLSDGGAQVELVLDRGLVRAGERQAVICEAELELKAGEPAALFRLARRIDAEIAVRLGVLTKAERGYRLLDTGPAVAKAEPLKLDPSISAGEAFRRIASACLHQYRLNEALLLGHYDARALHQARVATRRLRSAFTLFKPILPLADVARFQAELRWLAGMLGEARNLDVLTERVETGELRDRLEVVRQAAHVRVADWLRSARVRQLMIDLAEWLTLGAGAQVSEQQTVRDAPARDFAAKRLQRLYRHVAKRGERMEKLSDEARHEVRKDAKKLRYASEFFASIFTEKKQKRRHNKFIDALEDMQTGLGTLNDMVAGPDILAQHGLSDRLEVEVRPAKKRKLLAAVADAHDALVEAPRFWK